ncbi:hypothetical protein P8452_42112 [Trifolium repens]|nr:hypothetical protein P8452_42112 [Trifolium repens]
MNLRVLNLNWQHQLCKNPCPNPDIKTLFVDHSCGQPNGARAPSPANNPLLGSLPKAGGFSSSWCSWAFPTYSGTSANTARRLDVKSYPCSTCCSGGAIGLGAPLMPGLISYEHGLPSGSTIFTSSPTFYKIIKKKDVEEFKPDPYLATVLNCAFWVFYGMPFVHPNSLLVVTINGVGLVFRVCLSYHLLCLCRERRKEKVGLYLLVEAILFAAIVCS